MKITNTHGMPAVYERLIQDDQEKFKRNYDTPSFSVTTLAGSAWRYKLARKHEAEIETDARDMFFAFRGQMLHRALESAKLPNLIPELFLVHHIGNVRLSGRIDAIVPGGIEDYKMRTVEALWNFKDADRQELERQLNPYRYMLHQIYGMKVDKLTGHIFLMNWVNRKAKFDPTYPQKPHFSVDVPVWSMEETKSYLDERISAFLTPLEETEICSPADRWQQSTKWAVMKKGGKKAQRVTQSAADATNWIRHTTKQPLDISDEEALGAGLRAGYSIVERKGGDMRCQEYCAVNKFCKYWQDNYAAEELNETIFDATSDE